MEYIAVENTGKRDHGRPIFRLTRSLAYDPKRSWLIPVAAPAGFETDFSSVPRFFWRFASPFDAIEPAVIHDYLYRNHIGCREDADEIFLVAMKDYGVPRLRRWAMWRAVRAFGWITWKSCEVENG